LPTVPQNNAASARRTRRRPHARDRQTIRGHVFRSFLARVLKPALEGYIAALG
jgi:hypothetical protein